MRDPSEWLVDNRTLILSAAGRRALDVACGDGRNAAYLARLGFAVDAVDVSDVAVQAIQVAAADLGLAVHARRMDLAEVGLPAEAYDVIVQTYFLERGLFRALEEALAPGGILIAETFVRADPAELGGRVDPRFLLEPGELAATFTGLRVLRYQEHVSKRSGRQRAVASLAARREHPLGLSGEPGRSYVPPRTPQRNDGSRWR